MDNREKYVAQLKERSLEFEAMAREDARQLLQLMEAPGKEKAPGKLARRFCNDIVDISTILQQGCGIMSGLKRFVLREIGAVLPLRAAADGKQVKP